VEPWAALIIGAVGATACYFARGIQKRLKIDDALEVFRAHGVGGITGALMIGVFARKEIDGVSAGVNEFLVQLLGVVVVAAYTVLVTWLIMKILDAGFQLRASAEEEARGLDHDTEE
jgi:Amt family ammonium transporter